MRCALGLAIAAAGCKQLDCAQGTIESNGHCEPADVMTASATCGPDTKLEGTVCVSTVQCDPNTTMAMTDTATGITTCVGIAGGGCGICPQPASGKQSICGQLYDLETMAPFAAAGATGAKCPATPTAAGPCALAINAYDAIAFATNPATAQPLANGGVCIDDMGRYAIKDITPPGTNPFVGLGIDDANPANMGPAGVTNAVGIATPNRPDAATTNFEAYIVTKNTTDSWAASGGPSVSGGIFAMMFRKHCVGTGCTGDALAAQDSVQMEHDCTSQCTVIPPPNAKYFLAAETARDTIDPTAMQTGANGTGLNNNASVTDNLGFTGTGGITDTANCRWETHAGAALANIVFVQVFRKIGQIGKTCTE